MILRERQFTICLSWSCFLNMRDSVHYLDRANVIVLKTNRTYFVTPSVNSTCFLQFGQNMLSKSELLSLSGHYQEESLGMTSTFLPFPNQIIFMALPAKICVFTKIYSWPLSLKNLAFAKNFYCISAWFLPVPGR